MTALTVGGGDETAALLSETLKMSLATLDFTLVDTSQPDVGDAVTVDDPAWSGTISNIETVVLQSPDTSQHIFHKVTAVSGAVLADAGPAPFDLADVADPPDAYDWKTLAVKRTLRGVVEEVRATAVIYEPGVTPGMEINLDAGAWDVDDLFTVMDVGVEWQGIDSPVFTLELGLGDFATATTGAEDGGPLDPVTLPDIIGDAVDDGIGDAFDPGHPGADAIDAAKARGYSSTALAVVPAAIEDIPIADGQVALVWWEHDIGSDVGRIVYTPSLAGGVSSFPSGGSMGWVTGVGTFTVGPDPENPTQNIHVAVLWLGDVNQVNDS